MRDSCRVAAKVLRSAVALVAPGMTTAELDCQIGRFIEAQGATSAFLGYRKFPKNACVSINEEVIHGVAGGRRMQFGDLVKLDIGIRLNGFVGDVAMTVPVGGCSPAAQKLMDTTVMALHNGISKIKSGVLIETVSVAIQSVVEAVGYSVVREFVGHGVGKDLHEEPQLPNYRVANRNGRLQAGMTVAIEPMVNFGAPGVEVLDDGWTVVTKDRQLSAHFEHTVLVTEDGAEVLTSDGSDPLY